MSKKNKLKKFIFKKEDYPNYLEWLEKTDSDTKKQIEKLNKFSIVEHFEKDLIFSADGLIAAEGVGTNKFNNYTFARIAKALSSYLAINNVSDIIIATNNKENDLKIRDLVSLLKSNNVNSKMFDNSVVPVGFLSNYISKNNQYHGIYVNIINGSVELILINNTGEFYSPLNYFEFNKILKDTKIDFEKSSDFIIPNNNDLLINAQNEYENYAKEYLSGFNNYQHKESKLVINVHSDAIQWLLEKYNHNKNIYIVRSKTKRKSSDVSMPRSFIDAYKVAKKKKATVIATIDSSGQKANLAIKVKTTWKFFSSFEFGILLWAVNGKTPVNSYNTLPAFFENNEEANHSKLFLGTNFKHKWDTKYLDAVSLINFIVTNFLANPNIFHENNKYVKEEVGYFYEQNHIKDSSIEELTVFISNLEKYKKMNDMEVKSVKHSFEDDNFAIYRVTLENSEAILRLDKLNNKLYEYFYSYNKDNVTAFQARKGLKNTFNTFIEQKEDANLIHSKSGQKKLIIFFVFFLIATGAVYTFLFNWEQVWSALAIIFTSFNTIYPYLMFGLWFIKPLSGALVFYFIIRNYKQDAKVLDLYKAFILSAFIYAVAMIPAIGFTFFIWYLRTKGYKTSEVVPAISVEIVCSMLISLFFNLTLLPYGYYFLHINGYTSILIIILSIVGYIWYLFASSFFLVVSFSEKVQNFIFYWIEWGLFFVGLENIYTKVYDEMDFNILNMKKNRRIFRQNTTAVIPVLLTMISFKFIMGLQAFCAININPDAQLYNLFAIMAIQSIVHWAGSFVPIPGGAGVVDVILLDIMITLFDDIDVAKEIVFTWRFFMYYGWVMFTMIPFALKLIKMNRDNKNKVRNIWV